MDDALGVDDHVDLIEAHVEEPAALDDLEPLVHEGRGVDGDLAAHDPRRVGQRLGRRDGGQLAEGARPEGATGRRDDEAPHRLLLALEALPDRGGLAVDRQHGPAAQPGRLAHELARHDDDLLVGQRDGLARPQRRERRPQSRPAGSGDHHQVYVRLRHHGFDVRPASGGESVRTGAGAVDHARPELGHLLREQGHVAAGGEAYDLERAGQRPDHVEGLGADGPRGAEDDDAFRGDPLQSGHALAA